MTQRRWLYGLMGLLSLLGLIGIFTKERSFLFFFAFLVDFEYFFLKSDEMLEDYMNRSASRAFFCPYRYPVRISSFSGLVSVHTGIL